jgi:predicted TIM-barrel fold metal-dependent hydrolase
VAGTAADTGEGRVGTAGRIDVHHHIVPAPYVEAMNRAGYGTIGGVPFPKWDPSVLERSFDVLGIGKAIVSVSSPGVAVEDRALERDLARQVNEYTAGLIRDFAPRVGAFATVPMSSVDAAIAEAAYALDELKLNGLCLFSNHLGRYLGDPELDEFMDWLHRRQAVVFLHPTLPLESMWPPVSIDPPLVEFVFETTRAIANMLYNGIYERYPGIRFIVAHLGGTIPFVSWRLQLFEHSARAEFQDFRKRCPRPVREYLAGLYYEIAVACAPGNLQDVLSYVPIEHLLFGTDYPFAAQSFIDINSAVPAESGVLDAAAVEKLHYRNAESLFGFGEFAAQG